MRTKIIIGLAVLFCVIANLATGGTRSAKVTRIVDGDTFQIEGGEMVRLLGIDAPESKDPNKPIEYFSDRSESHLAGLIEGATVTLWVDSKDKYGRLLCLVQRDSILVNLRMIADGYATAYLRFPHEREETFLKAELSARRKAIGMWRSPRDTSGSLREEITGRARLEKERRIRLGIWGKDNPTRENYYSGMTSEQLLDSLEREEQVANAVVQQPKTGAVTVYITRTGAKYHRSGCSSLRKSKIAISKSDAEDRGYTPCGRCRP